MHPPIIPPGGEKTSGGALNLSTVRSELLDVRNFRTARRAALPAAAAVLGALVATPAFADVTVSPATAVQCTGENLYFTVTNEGTRAIRTVTLAWPADTPVAEVYPLSVDDWAPRINYQKLSRPLSAIHGTSPVTEAAKSITWLAVSGRELAPGGSTRLAVALGPLPTVSSMRFNATPVYVDGTTGAAMPAQLGLTPAADCGTATGHQTHEDAAGTAGTAEDQLFRETVADATRGPSIWSAGGWVLAALMFLGGLFAVLRGRHRAEEDDEPEDNEPAHDEPAHDAKQEARNGAAETDEPVAAGRWSLRG
jgi:Domain of unkown function (DUF1775)